MTSFRIPIKEEQYSTILNDYLASEQLGHAFAILETMPPQMLYFSRFLKGCVEQREMVGSWVLGCRARISQGLRGAEADGDLTGFRF